MQVLADVAAGRIKVLFVSPERLNNPHLLEALRPCMPLPLVVVDEAHCVAGEVWEQDSAVRCHRDRESTAFLDNLNSCCCASHCCRVGPLLPSRVLQIGRSTGRQRAGAAHPCTYCHGYSPHRGRHSTGGQLGILAPSSARLESGSQGCCKAACPPEKPSRHKQAPHDMPA
jgi:hypothetical protein